MEIYSLFAPHSHSLSWVSRDFHVEQSNGHLSVSVLLKLPAAFKTGQPSSAGFLPGYHAFLVSLLLLTLLPSLLHE